MCAAGGLGNIEKSNRRSAMRGGVGGAIGTDALRYGRDGMVGSQMGTCNLKHSAVVRKRRLHGDLWSVWWLDGETHNIIIENFRGGGDRNKSLDIQA